VTGALKSKQKNKLFLTTVATRLLAGPM
jgi:hypothetical protein